MNKREPLWEWFLSDSPAPKTTLIYERDWKSWFVFPKGLSDEHSGEYDTWAEAWAAALQVEGLT